MVIATMTSMKTTTKMASAITWNCGFCNNSIMTLLPNVNARRLLFPELAYVPRGAVSRRGVVLVSVERCDIKAFSGPVIIDDHDLASFRDGFVILARSADDAHDMPGLVLDSHLPKLRAH